MEKKNEIQKVFNLIIIDESGSMSMIEKQAVSGLNETFQTIMAAQRKYAEQEHYVSFVTFNSNGIKTVMNRLRIEPDKQIEWTDYKPDACTPLFDAMGQSINELKGHVKDDEDVVLVTIITDGMENASREFCGKDIKKLVSDMKERGWVFAYIGTNQDVDAVADSMGIQSRMAYEYSQAGAQDMFKLENDRRTTFYDTLSYQGREAIIDTAGYDFFDSDGKEKKDSTPDLSTAETNTDDEKRSKGFWARLKDYI